MNNRTAAAGCSAIIEGTRQEIALNTCRRVRREAAL
jgi:hypothetical protein